MECSWCWIRGSYAQHVRGKLDFNGFFRAILPTGPAVPALLRIFQIRKIGFPRGLHVYGVCWTDIVTRAAATAFFHVKDGWHFILS
jgi:hypothetical protein